MSMYKLENIDSDGNKLTSEFQTENLSDLLDYITYFLKGTGYHFDGQLTIAKDDV